MSHSEQLHGICCTICARSHIVAASAFAGCALMFVHSAVCATHWLVVQCWVQCALKLLLDVLLVFRNQPCSQETVALYVQVQTRAASRYSSHVAHVQLVFIIFISS